MNKEQKSIKNDQMNKFLVSSQKFGAEKIDHPDEPRPEAASLLDNQCSQTILPQNIEKIQFLDTKEEE